MSTTWLGLGNDHDFLQINYFFKTVTTVCVPKTGLKPWVKDPGTNHSTIPCLLSDTDSLSLYIIFVHCSHHPHMLTSYGLVYIIHDLAVTGLNQHLRKM